MKIDPDEKLKLEALDMSYPEPDAARRRELWAIRRPLAK